MYYNLFRLHEHIKSWTGFRKLTRKSCGTLKINKNKLHSHNLYVIHTYVTLTKLGFRSILRSNTRRGCITCEYVCVCRYITYEHTHTHTGAHTHTHTHSLTHVPAIPFSVRCCYNASDMGSLSSWFLPDMYRRQLWGASLTRKYY